MKHGIVARLGSISQSFAQVENCSCHRKSSMGEER
jgi:hypothetical protein